MVEVTMATMGLLNRHPDRIEMVRVWPAVNPPPEWRKKRKMRERVLVRWADLAGVPEFMVRDNWRRLLVAGLINEDGTVPPAVTQYVSEQTIDDGPSTMRRRIEERRREERERRQREQRNE